MGCHTYKQRTSDLQRQDAFPFSAYAGEGFKVAFHNATGKSHFARSLTPGYCMQKGAFTSVRLTLESAEVAGELHGTDVILLSKLDPFNVSVRSSLRHSPRVQSSVEHIELVSEMISVPLSLHCYCTCYKGKAEAVMSCDQTIKAASCRASLVQGRLFEPKMRLVVGPLVISTANELLPVQLCLQSTHHWMFQRSHTSKAWGELLCSSRSTSKACCSTYKRSEMAQAKTVC